MNRNWLDVGAAEMRKAFEGGSGRWRGVEYDEAAMRALISKEIDDLEWRVPQGMMPFSPAIMLQEIIKEMRLPRVGAVAINGYLELPDGPETATYSIYGIESRFKNELIRLYVLDMGVGAVSLAVDEDVEVPAMQDPAAKKWQAPKKPEPIPPAAEPYTAHGYAPLDLRDSGILLDRVRQLDAVEGPRCGDYVEFADGVVRRISYLWEDTGPQTSDGGSFYLGNGYVSMSGSLYSTVPLDSLTRREETRPGDVWFFHHDHAGAGRGVHTAIPFRVYDCNLPAPR